MLLYVFFCSLLLFLSTASYAQIFHSGRQPGAPSALVSARGHVLSSSSTNFAGLAVRLTGSAAYAPPSYISANGEFQFDSVPPGSYVLELIDISGNRIAQQMVSIGESYSELSITLPDLRGSRPISGMVSVFELGHKISSKAKKEFELALKASRKNDTQASLHHLQAAVDIDPEYLEARRQLGLRYVELGQPEKIIEQFSEVLKLDARSAQAHENIGAAHLLMSHLAEAESAERRAISIDPTLIRARFVLGLSLAAQNKRTAEALALMVTCEDKIPVAHFIAAQLLANQGDMDRARMEAAAYLASGEGSHRTEAEQWLRDLEGGVAPKMAASGKP